MPFFGGSGQYVIVGTNIKGGNDAAPNVIGDNNIALGNGALEAITLDSGTVAVGNNAARYNTAAGQSVYIGNDVYDGEAGDTSVIIGWSACAGMAPGNAIVGSVYIGRNCQTWSGGGASSNVIIGEGSYSNGNECIVIGAQSHSIANCLVIGTASASGNAGALIVGNSSYSSDDNVVVLGHNLTSTVDDQIMIGDVSHTSIIIGGLDFSGGPGGASTWGDISGTLSDQTDLQNALDAKLDVTAARELLTANRTYYVATTGNDSNDGLTVGAPFLTVQKAVNTACGLDLSIYSVTIQCADGTYDGAIFLKPYLGTGPITIQGNTGNSSAVILNHSATTVGANSFSGRWDVKYVKITSGGNGVLSNLGSKVFVDSVVFGACAGYHMAAIQGAIVVSGNYTINGAAAAHWYVTGGGSITCSSKTITISGTPAFTYFAQSTQLGFMSVGGNTYSGSATGARYIANLNAVIDSGATTLPGNVAGSTATGGQYA